MLYCRCGGYLLWERDHWACIGCGQSPWRCECKGEYKRYEIPREQPQKGEGIIQEDTGEKCPEEFAPELD